MLCSISTRKSNSNWLDRLRSSRGFPTGAGLDLDHCLAPQSPDFSDPTNPDLVACSCQPSPILDPTRTEEVACENGEKDWFGIMSNVLAELFVMGESGQNPNVCSKKSSRKQANPRNFVTHSKSSSIFSNHGILGPLPSNSDGSFAERNGGNGEVRIGEPNDAGGPNDDDGDGDDEKCYGDLKEFSRTEVTVIDTSCTLWKFEKLLFRRKNVWKVRDKKCRWKNVVKKKRGVISCDESVGDGKKLKAELLQHGSLKEAQGEDGSREEARKRTDVFTQVPKRRFPLPRFPIESRDGGSPPFNRAEDAPASKLGPIAPKAAPSSRSKDGGRLKGSSFHKQL